MLLNWQYYFKPSSRSNGPTVNRGDPFAEKTLKWTGRCHFRGELYRGVLWTDGETQADLTPACKNPMTEEAASGRFVEALQDHRPDALAGAGSFS